MSPNHWDIVTHSVHIYCEWLGCLLPKEQKQQSTVHLPHALLTRPTVYACRFLAALSRFFAPRTSSTNSVSRADDIFNLFDKPARNLPDPTIAKVNDGNSIEDILRGEWWFLDLPLSNLYQT